MTSETRYMRNDNVLGTTESTPVTEDFCDLGTREYFGIRVWILHADASRTEVLGLAGIASAVNSLAAGAALTTTISAGFTVASNVAMVATDEVQVEVYADVSNPPTALIEVFTTSGLNATQLDAGNWTVYYRVRRTTSVGGNSNFYFRFGAAGDDSYITTFQYTPSAVVAEEVQGDGLTFTTK